MKKQTEKQKFITYLQDKGYDVSSEMLFATMSLIPRHRVTFIGNHNIISGIRVVNFDGSNTQDGELGCVTFCFSGIQRRYRCQTVNESAEILKLSVCPKTAKIAILYFEHWQKTNTAILNQWKTIL